MRRTSQWFLILAITLGLFMPAAVTPAQAAATPVFINEIHYDNDGTDSGEAIEIAGPAGTDLTGWSLVLYNGNGGAVYDTDALSGTIPDQQSGYGTVVMTYPVNGIQNGSPDGVALVNPSSVVIQFLSYEGTFTAVGGPADGIASVDIGVSEPNTTPVGYSLQLSGTGTVYEDFIWSAPAANTFGSVNNGQTFGGGPVGPSVIINEVDADTPGTDAAEFIELYDGGTGNTSLDGLVVVFYNGSNDLSYAAYDLDGMSTDANGYFLLGNTALTPDVIFAGNFLQNGQDAVALYQANAADFPNNTLVTTANLIDALVYDTSDVDDPGLLALLNPDQPQVDENANSSGATESNQRCPNGSGGARNTNTYDQWAPTARSANTCTPPPEACGDPFTGIYAVQGNGLVSPLVGQIVAVEGVVVGDFQNNDSPDNGNLNGFHIQDAAGDGDAATSDGVFIYAPGAMDVAVGDAVRVRGSVSEYNGMTEITVAQLWVCSTGNSVAPTPLSLPVTSLAEFEPYEGMLVTFPQALVISEYFDYDRYGEIVLTSERHLTPTAEVEPGPDAIAAAQEFLLDSITLDDGRTSQNPDPAIHPNGAVFDLSNLFRGGDTVTNVTGVLDYSFDLYRIQPVLGADYTSVNPRTAQPTDVGGSLKVASFNVLNYFTTIDTGVPMCGPLEDQECRGADTEEEFYRQRTKIIAALSAINADVVGLIEIENHPFDVPTADLVAGLNEVMGAGTYDYIVTNAIGTDAIRQALIYKPAAVTPWGGYAVLTEFVDPRFLDDYNRPVLAQSFVDHSTGGIFTVAVNHLKSKGSDCNAIGDPDLGDGAGNCNLTRKAAAEALVDWLATDPTGSGDTDALIIGDLNSYDKEDPIDVLLAGGYTDLVYKYEGEYAYSYVFDGQTGYLDHALANASLLGQVTGATAWHINADEADLIDYDMSFKLDAQDALWAPDPYRSSDHDPVIVGLNLQPEIIESFVTAGGWIDSPAGTYAPDPAAQGKAFIPFNIKYKKGALAPTGNLQFTLSSAGLDFRSTSYDWLVINQSGTIAQFKGQGTLNGTGPYEFMVWVGDGTPDTYRIRIVNGGGVVYDNGSMQPIGAGSVQIHMK